MQTIVKQPQQSKTFAAKVFKFECPNPWALLALHEQNFVWRDRNTSGVWLALGDFRSTSSLDECRVWLSQTELEGEDTEMTPRCFGSAAFEPDTNLNGIWNGFSPRKYVLPKILIRAEAGRATAIVFTQFSQKDFSVTKSNLSELGQTAAAKINSIPVFKNSNLFSKPHWNIAVGCIREQILAGNLDKAVLARAELLESETGISAEVLLNSLVQSSQDSFLFFEQAAANRFFIGSSPERLFRAEKDNLYSESLAGTRPRSYSASADEELAGELLQSPKDRAEQALVTEYLADTMNRLCSFIKVGSYPNVKKFQAVQHLSTPVEGILRTGITLDKILLSLHPTPAVCGTPTQAAKDLLKKFETVPRGLYSGAVGWISEYEAEFAVGIRSALVENNKAYLFAGAGIVADSDAEQEYEECSLKMAVMKNALTYPA